MTVRYILLLSFLASYGELVGQNRASTMCFGSVCVDFRTDPPTVVTSAMDGGEASASICTESGNLLFYTNGGDSPTGPTHIGGVWNSQHQLMPNGWISSADSSGCKSSFMGSVIIPFPFNSRDPQNPRYYIFTRDCVESSFSLDNYNAGLTYSVVDMSANGGLGAVVEKNQQVVPFSSTGSIATNHEPIAAVQHANNHDYWLFSYTNDSLYSIKIDEDGIGSFRSYFDANSQLIISPARNHLISGDRIYHFDASTAGLQYAGVLLNSTPDLRAFSPDGSLLYEVDGNILYQSQLSVFPLQITRVQIADIGEPVEIFLGPDARIYLESTATGSVVGFVDCPNTEGVGCQLTMQQLPFGSGSVYNKHTNVLANYLYYQHDNCFVGVSEVEESKISVRKVGNTTYRIELTKPQKILVSLFDANGRCIRTKQFHGTQNDFQLGRLPSGVYIISIQTSDEQRVQRVVVLND